MKKNKSNPNGQLISLVFDRRNPGNIYPKQWTKLSEAQLPAHVGSRRNEISLKPSLTKKDFKDKSSSWVLIYSLSYLDFTKSKRISKTLTVSGTINENNQFDLRYDILNLVSIKKYFEEKFKMGEYIFTK